MEQEQRLQEEQALRSAYSLLSIINPYQLQVMLYGLFNGYDGEDSDWYKTRINELANTFKTMPQTGDQDGKGDDAVAYLHYFKDGCDWYITEKDMLPEQIQAFGLAVIHQAELGYISLIELVENGVEIDLHWTPKTIGEIKANI